MCGRVQRTVSTECFAGGRCLAGLKAAAHLGIHRVSVGDGCFPSESGPGGYCLSAIGYEWEHY